MKITREMVVAAGGCDQGLANFDYSFPSGEGDYKEVMKEAFVHDKRGGDVLNAGFILAMKTDVRLLILSGQAKMAEKYQVFNPLAGLYTQYNTLEEAKVARQAAIDAYIQANIGLFPIAQEFITSDGDSLWGQLTEDSLR